MSITDELRKWNTGRLRPDHAAELDAIADRIEKRHTEERDKAYCKGVYDAIDADKNAMGYVKLPVDADGVPIHVGDNVECGGNTIEVIGFGNVTSDDDGYGVFTQGKDGCYEWYNARFCRHIQPDSWERIIGDAIDAAFEGVTDESEFDLRKLELVERCRRLAEKESHVGA